jgi:hypothetical protein
MRYLFILLPLLLVPAAPCRADVHVGVGIAVPGVSIGINMPAYPRLVRIPGYPVYYDPYVNLNFFFYDGLYWVFQDDHWYVSSWYNGPWDLVDPYDVPLYVLRVPVRYYRHPPQYFHGWHRDAPPRWGDHWGREWAQRRNGWDHWERRAAPPPAPLPRYQRQFSGPHYPREQERQRTIRSERYRYEPREPISRRHFEQPGRGRGEPRMQRQPEGRGDRGH